MGIGIEQIFQAVIQKIPPPQIRDGFNVGDLGSVWFCVSHSPHLIFNLVGSCWNLAAQWAAENDPRGNEGASTLVKVHGLGLASVAWILGHRLFSKNSAHVGPFAELGLVLVEALDPNSKTVLVPLATLGYMLHNWRRGRGDEVRVKAADIKESWALAVLRAQDTKAVPDVDEATSVGDDGAVVALVVRDTFVALGSCVVSAILKDVVNIRSCLVCESSCALLVVIRGNVPILILHHLNDHLDTV